MKFLIILSLLFLISEFFLLLFRRSKISHRQRGNDRGSLVLLWITITLCFTFGFTFANYNRWELWNYMTAIAGFILIIAGLIIRWLAIYQLKNAFTVDVAIAVNQKLKTDRIYKYVRHPSYLGLLLIMIGFSICMNSIISILIIIIPIILVVLYRIRVEEKILLEEFGADYENYKSTTSMIFSGIY